jgi:hypothetical protein
MTQRVFFLTDHPYTRMMESYTDGEAFRRAGFEYTVLDAGDLFAPELRHVYGDLASGEFVWRILDKAELRMLAAQFTKEDVVLFEGFTSDLRLSDIDSVYGIVSSSPAVLVGASTGLTQPNLPPSQDVSHFISRIFRLFADIASRPSEHAPRLGRRLKRVAVSLTCLRSELDPKLQSLRPLDYLWIGHTKDYVSDTIISATTKVRFIHTMDYEKILREDIRPLDECKSLVYIDSMGPRHPDQVAKARNDWLLSPDEHDALIHRTLNSLAIITGCDLVIAAHPRAPRGTTEGLYGAFPVVYGETPSLIASARAVILTKSTSVGMAAVARRPVIFLSSRRFGKSVIRFQKDYARWLHASRVDIESPIINWTIPTIDVHACDAYVRMFLKRQGSLPGPFWDQVAKEILNDLEDVDSDG